VVVVDHGMSMRREADITCKLEKVYLSRVFSGLRPAGDGTGLDNAAEQRGGVVANSRSFGS
jgi:hypothetical protein